MPIDRRIRGDSIERLGFTASELRCLRVLHSPAGVQRALDAMPYHLATTAWSPARVLAERTAHCLEGAIFAAAALRVLGLPPLLLDLEAVQDTDHVIAGLADDLRAIRIENDGDDQDAGCPSIQYPRHLFCNNCPRVERVAAGSRYCWRCERCQRW